MLSLSVGRLRVTAVVERAGPTRPTWLLPAATPEAIEPHSVWLAPHFLDERGRFLQSVHSFVVRAPGLTALVDTCIGNDKDRGGQPPFHMLHTTFLDDLRAAGVRGPRDLHPPARRSHRLEHASRRRPLGADLPARPASVRARGVGALVG